MPLRSGIAGLRPVRGIHFSGRIGVSAAPTPTPTPTPTPAPTYDPEAGLTLTTAIAPNAVITITNITAAHRAQDAVFAMDVDLSSGLGVLMEIGGGGEGSYFGRRTNGDLVIRGGSGSTSNLSSTNVAGLLVPAASVPTGTGTLVVEFRWTDPAKAVRAWWNGILLEGTVYNGTTAPATWAGANDGGVYMTAGGAYPAGENVAPWSGVIGSGLRFYGNQRAATP